MEQLEGFKYDLGVQRHKKRSNYLCEILNREVSNYFKNIVLILNISTFEIENMHMHHKIFIKCVLILILGKSA